jgi:hypothetical protein
VRQFYFCIDTFIYSSDIPNFRRWLWRQARFMKR